MAKFKNKYRIGSHRKPYWDYSANALYFLTIVTQNRKCILGKVINAEMILSDMGKIVNDEFLRSFDIRNELFLCEYIIMPNHLHTILEIRNPGPVKSDGRPIRSIENANPHGTVADPDGPIVDTNDRSYQPSRPIQSTGNPNPHGPIADQDGRPGLPVRLPKSISSFMAGFKSAVNSKIDDYIDEYQLKIPKYNRNNHFFQPNYHDHIIRNDFEYHRIACYIRQNPLKWNQDTLSSD